MESCIYPLKSLLVYACALLMSHAAFSTTYYVKNSGDDSLNGLDEANAWASVARVNLQSLLPGDRVCFQAGDVFDDATLEPDSGSDSAVIEYTSYGSGDRPILTTAMTLPNSGWSDYSADIYSYPLATETCMVVSDTTYCPPAKTLADLVDGEYFWDSAGTLYVYDSAGSPNVSGKSFRVGQRENVVSFTGQDYVVLNGLRFEVSNNSLARFSSGSTHNTITDCEFYYASSDNVSAGAGVHASGATGLRVLNSRFSHLEGDGIYMQRASGYEVIGNEIDYIYDVGGDPGGDCIQISGKTGYPSDDFVISNNIARRESKETNKGCIIAEFGSGGIISGNHVYQGRFGIASYSSNVVIEYNYCEDMGWFGGIRLWENRGQGDVTIRYNIIDGAGNSGLNVGNSSRPPTDMHNIVIRNNLIYNTYYGVSISVPVSGEFKNNIVWSDVSSNPNFRLSVAAVITGETFDCDHNILQTPDSREIVKWLGTSYYDLASYQLATGQGAHSISNHPDWVDAANSDFHLNDTSPAIDAGDTPVGVTTDFYGNTAPQGSSTDIGPAEAGSLVVYEGFDYTTGTLTIGDGGLGWSGDWVESGGAGVVSIQTDTAYPGDLLYPDLNRSGNRLNLYDTDGAHQTLTRSLSQSMGGTTGTYWISFLVRKHTTGRSFTFDMDGFSFYVAASDWQVKTPGTPYVGLTGATYNSTHFFVARVDSTLGGDTVYVWVDPDLSAGEPSLGSADRTIIDSPFTFDSVGLRQGPWGNNTQSTSVDEIHIGLSFADVTDVP